MTFRAVTCERLYLRRWISSPTKHWLRPCTCDRGWLSRTDAAAHLPSRTFGTEREFPLAFPSKHVYFRVLAETSCRYQVRQPTKLLLPRCLVRDPPGRPFARSRVGTLSGVASGV